VLIYTDIYIYSRQFQDRCGKNTTPQSKKKIVGDTAGHFDSNNSGQKKELERT
jgi:hypothetical protein